MFWGCWGDVFGMLGECFQNGLGVSILTTPKGVMTDIDARKQKVGGEIICKVF